MHIRLTTRLLALGVGIYCGVASIASAQTLESGNVSGTWSPSGNPYIATDNCTVPAGQTLTLQPGVVFWIGSNLTVTVNGTITATGTPTDRITIQAPGAASYYWNAIYLYNSSGIARFHYCDFGNAQTAIYMANNADSANLSAEIFNCTFSNCVSQGILGQALGYANWQSGAQDSGTITAIVNNCIFSATSNGISLYINGASSQYSVSGLYIGYAYAYPTICNNIFQNLTGDALVLTTGSGGYCSGQPTFLNNTLVSCAGGVKAVDPWDAIAENNIFMGVTNACIVSGSLSRIVGYNCFYQNATNFTGYPGTYGERILNNRNGTPCDILYNIYQNPLFATTTNLYLATDSPCINAGLAGQAYENMCFPPLMGAAYNLYPA